MERSYVWSCVALCLLSILYVNGNRHTHGPAENFKGDVMFRRRIFVKNATIPTNYTILFKYIRPHVAGTVSHVLFDVNCESTGTVTHRPDVGPRRDVIVETKLKVFNCLNLTLDGEIHGFGATETSQLFSNPYNVELFGDRLFTPKSFTLVYAHNHTLSESRIVTIGQRQKYDTLLKYESKIITKVNQFPEFEFSYIDTINHITSVRFEFNTLTAVAFVKSSAINEHEFSAVLYDLNNDQFAVKISIYGFERNRRPPNYASIIS